ncbi:MAG: hypothetical protein PF445_03685 [Melioribacteraceae bacterium]|jgi:hypothetical protein|nr:hypothetical protein [Melioribacteraceae bacterium]
MNYKKSSNISEELLDRIISVAYGSASFFEKRRIEKLATENEAVKELLDEYKSTAQAVHSIPKEEYTGELKVKNISELSKSIFDDFYLILIGKPVITAVTTVLLIFAITFSLFNNRELTYEGYSVAEVQKANLETKQALQIVQNIFSKTEDKIKYDILTNEVSKPIKDGMNTVNKLFKKEKENEPSEKKS